MYPDTGHIPAYQEARSAALATTLALGRYSIDKYYHSRKRPGEGTFPPAKRQRTMVRKRYASSRGTYISSTGRTSRGPRTRMRRTRRRTSSKASYSTRARTSNSRRYAKRQNLGLGFPPRLTGVLKMFQTFAGVTAEGSTFLIGQFNIVDMNNDQRAGATQALNDGTSHWNAGTAGVTVGLYRTPYFFDTLKSLYNEYYITKIKMVTKFMMEDTDVKDDITICYKTFKPHDDTGEVIRDSVVPEQIASQDRMRKFKLSPLNTARNGQQSKTIVQTWIPKNWIPARVWFSEQEDVAGVGSKVFTDVTQQTKAQAAHAPRCMYWAWDTRTETSIEDAALTVISTVYYTYTAFGRKLPAVS